MPDDTTTNPTPPGNNIVPLVNPAGQPLRRFSTEFVARSAVVGKRPLMSPFTVPSFPPMVERAVKEAGIATIAMDEFIGSNFAWGSTDTIANAYAEGIVFLGYSYLATLAQRAEYRVVTETIAAEMTREWIELKVAAEDEHSDVKKQIEDELDRLNVRHAFRKAAESDGFFGRGHLYLDTGMTDDADELLTDIGDGRNMMSKLKIGPEKSQKLIGVRPVEASWCYPTHYESVDPLKRDWYAPVTWYVMSREVHRSRLMTFIGREVPDILKPAYAFGGLSMSQMLKPYVDNWLRTRQSVSDLIQNFSFMVLKTNMDASTGVGGEQILQRVAVFNNVKNNQGCLPAETLITTERGDIPISDVTIADRVMTRNGWAPLVWSGITGYNNKLVEITTSSGACLRATDNHPIYLPNIDRFVNASLVKDGDCLAECVIRKTSTAIQSSTADIGGVGIRLVITAMSTMVACCIEFFGRIMSGLSPMGMSSITATEIVPSSPTWSSLHLANTPASIWKGGDLDLRDTILSNIKLREQFARNVVLNLFGSVRLVVHDFIAAINVAASLTSVVGTRSVNIAKQPVYNLEVADGYLPEYFANGVLVHNCVVLDKDTEDWANVSAPIGGLDHLQAQAQEHLASISRIPLVKLLGIQPAGLNASSEGELVAFEDWIAAFQEAMFRKPLTTIIDFIQLSLFGEINHDITFEFKPLRQLNPTEQAALEATIAQTREIYMQGGSVDAEEVREALANDPNTPFNGIDLDKPLPPPPAGGMPGMPPMPGAGGPPGGAPPNGAGPRPPSPGGPPKAPAPPALPPRDSAPPADAQPDTQPSARPRFEIRQAAADAKFARRQAMDANKFKRDEQTSLISELEATLVPEIVVEPTTSATDSVEAVISPPDERLGSDQQPIADTEWANTGEKVTEKTADGEYARFDIFKNESGNIKKILSRDVALDADRLKAKDVANNTPDDEDSDSDDDDEENEDQDSDDQADDADFREDKVKRDDGGKFSQQSGSGGKAGGANKGGGQGKNTTSSSGSSKSARAQATRLTAQVKTLAKKFDYPEELVSVEDLESFTLNGEEFEGAGLANYDTGHISIAPTLPRDQLREVMVHEIFHQKQEVAETTSDEFADYVKANFKALASDDGVTPYSKDWWKEYNAHPRAADNRFNAIAETLAEIAVRKEYKIDQWVTPVWMKLFNIVEDTYAKVRAREARTGRALFHKQSRNPVAKAA